MKKKFFAVALATTMALSTALTANAASISGGWWTAWTEGYELKDSLEFDIDVKGGDAVWNSFAAVFTNSKITGSKVPAEEVGESYKEYAVIRGDNCGWGNGEAFSNKALGGGDITYEGGNVEIGDEEFIAIMKDCHVDVTITKNNNDVTMVYDINGANGKNVKRTAKFTSDMSDGVYVFFSPDGAEITVTPVDNPTPNPTPDPDPTPTPNPTPDDPKKDEPKKDEPVQSGDVAPIAAFAAVAVVACATVVVSRKKVTE